LMSRLADWASEHGYRECWVATGGRAVAFYQHCGWHVVETAGEDAAVRDVDAIAADVWAGVEPLLP